MASVISLYLAGKAREIKRDQHHQYEMNSIIRPMQIKLRAASQIFEMQQQLDADKKLAAVFATLKLTNPPE